MTTNINPNIYAVKNAAPPRVTLTVIVTAPNTYTIKNGAATLGTGIVTKEGPYGVGTALLRAAATYDPSTWVDFLMPLNGGGSVTHSVMITHGMKASNSIYNG